MIDPPPPGRARARSGSPGGVPMGLALAAFALVAALYFHWGTSDRLLSFGGDNATYLLIARDLSPFGASSPGAAGYARQHYYPPLYPAFLAITGAAHGLVAAHVATIASLLAGIAVLFAWCRTLGLTRMVSVGLALAFAAVRGTYFTALEIESEPLYLLLSLVALAATQRAQRSTSGIASGVAALAVGATTLTRSAGLALLAAHLVWLGLHRPKRFLALGLIALVPAIVWMRHGGNSDYTRILVERYRDGGAAGIVDGLRLQVSSLAQDWLGLFALEPATVVVIVVTGLTALGLAGAVMRLRRGELDALYLGAYLALIVIWPFPGEMARFLVVVLPIALVHAAWALEALLAKLPDRRAARWIALASAMAFASVLVPQIALTATRFHAGARPELAGLRRSAMWFDPDRVAAEKMLRFAARLEDALRRVHDHVPADACVFSVKPSLVGLFADRRSVYTPPASLDDAAFHREIENAGCRDFFLIAADTQSAGPLYPRERFDPPLAEIDVTRVGDEPASRLVAILARLPDATPPSSSSP